MVGLSVAILPSIADPGSSGRTPSAGWELLSNPITDTGVVHSPCLCQIRGRVHLFWAGTNKEIRNPELFMSARGEGDAEWTKSRAPFFGSDLGRVRSVAVATARDYMGVLFQREATVGNGAMEVMLTTSSDMGYDFSTPFLLDSFVLGDSLGSNLAMAARQGKQRPEFAAAWISEDAKVKAASIDTRRDSRPEAATVGQAPSIRAKVDVVGCGTEGFFAVFGETLTGLKSAHLKPLVGGAEPTISLWSQDCAQNFAGAYLYRGPGYVVASSDSKLKVFRGESGALTEISSSKDEMKGKNLQVRCTVDEKQRIHRVVLNPKENRLYYQFFEADKWTTPELIVELDKDIPLTGFDAVATEESLWLVTAQSQIFHTFRRRLK